MRKKIQMLLLVCLVSCFALIPSNSTVALTTDLVDMTDSGWLVTADAFTEAYFSQKIPFVDFANQPKILKQMDNQIPFYISPEISKLFTERCIERDLSANMNLNAVHDFAKSKNSLFAHHSTKYQVIAIDGNVLRVGFTANIFMTNKSTGAIEVGFIKGKLSLKNIDGIWLIDNFQMTQTSW